MMGLFSKRRSQRNGTRTKPLSILFTTDLHGSEAAFRKYVNAAVKFNADACVLGGDLTGKALVPLVEDGGEYSAEFMGRRLSASTDQELADIERTIRLAGQYPFRTTAAGVAHMRDHPEAVDEVFLAAMRESLHGWFDLAAERLGDRGVKLFAICGNDDPLELDEVLASHAFVEHVDGRVAELAPGIAVLGFSGANRTPWNSPREFDEDDIRARLERSIGMLEATETSIWNIHVPPRNSGLDTCAEVRADLTVVSDGGEPRLHGAGSTAVRELIEAYQPQLTVHGHIHESRGISKLGTTVSVNPGSEYTEGILRAAFIRIGTAGVKTQLLST